MSTSPEKLYAVNLYPQGLDPAQGRDVARTYMVSCEIPIKTFAQMTGITLSRLRRLMMENSQVVPTTEELEKLRDAISKDTEARRQRLQAKGQLIAD